MTTPNLDLEEWEQDQDQPHITVNTALRILELMCQLRILDRDLAAPPGAPNDGDCYLIAAGASGEWTDRTDQIALYVGTSWIYLFPKSGWRAYIVDEGQNVQYSGGSPSAWVSV